MPKVSFNNKQSPFFKSLKLKVDYYFSNNDVHIAGNSKLYFKGILLISLALFSYITLVFFYTSLFISLALCFLLGVLLAAIGFNIMHEGAHDSFSKHKWINKTCAYSLNALGGNSHFWKLKHNVSHHTYTNIEGMDFDIDVRPFMRLHKDQPRLWFHKYQHIYWIILYGISYVVWIFFHDFKKYFSSKIANAAEVKKLETEEHLIFWFTKVIYLAVYIIIPIVMLGVGKAAIGFSIIAAVCGIFISVVFQLAHIVEDTHFPETINESSRIDQEWAIHQVTTTANFATKNKAVSWLLGGLNFQVEHHLFPRVSHIHYPVISEFVKETCLEFDVNYIEYSSVTKAFNSHLLFLKRLGTV